MFYAFCQRRTRVDILCNSLLLRKGQGQKRRHREKRINGSSRLSQDKGQGRACNTSTVLSLSENRYWQVNCRPTTWHPEPLTYPNMTPASWPNMMHKFCGRRHPVSQQWYQHDSSNQGRIFQLAAAGLGTGSLCFLKMAKWAAMTEVGSWNLQLGKNVSHWSLVAELSLTTPCMTSHKSLENQPSIWLQEFKDRQKLFKNKTIRVEWSGAHTLRFLPSVSIGFPLWLRSAVETQMGRTSSHISDDLPFPTGRSKSDQTETALISVRHHHTIGHRLKVNGQPAAAAHEHLKTNENKNFDNKLTQWQRSDTS